ncbi:sensor histidine kinase [Pararhizobium haloflavum]|uniref:sensor histidine kinase n=1 Tax=Pararhizobium haloflavum TaxID=2037914 RepID=UPI000C187634|nr:sensor histidine kinase KdpD [Pararhizobium haloflavum]
MSDKEKRPEPEALLAEASKEGKGRLKIFLGAAPGVGKTFAMLEAARQRQAANIDVVVGVVETHGRAETERLVAGLEVIPRMHLAYGGRYLPEMDLDAVLQRRPALVLVDELAHTNVSGSLHVKRFQDVEEILNAGIDVYATLNIQHLESLNDIVARISNVRVRETIPDGVLELADEIELIDLPPEELIERLRQGKVYVQDQIARAIQNFFSKGNLTALRELAMRVAADRVDAQMTAHMKSHAIAGPWPAQDRILVCVNEAPVAKTMIRAAKRMAERARVPWIALSVVTPASENLPDTAKDARAEALRLADSLGAEVVTLNAESDVANEIIGFAQNRNVNRILIGRPRARNWFARFQRETVADRLIREGEKFEITIISPDQKLGAGATVGSAVPKPKWEPKAYGVATLATAAAGLVATLANQVLPTESLSLFFLVAVLATATRFGLWPSIYASVLSFLTYNFFLTEPYYTFHIAQEHLILTLFLFLAVAIVTGNLAARLRTQIAAQRAITKRTSNLYEFSRKIASVAALDDVIWAAVHHVASTLQCASLILMPDEKGQLEVIGGFPPEDRLDIKDRGAAKWAWENGEPAGWSSSTLPTSSWLFLPLKTAQGTRGLLGVKFGTRDQLDPEQRRLLDALVDQVAIAIERTLLASDMEETRLLSETERLRAALLSSVSHDLRTPLVSIIGAASTLVESEDVLDARGRLAMAETIRDEGERLNRYVQNLLDMTRLGYGALQPRLDAVELSDILGRALRQLRHGLENHQLVRVIPHDLPPIAGDPVLLEQVLANLLDNAAKYAPAGTKIEVSARLEGDNLVVAVSDEGPGIPAVDRDKIFDMFYRVRAGDGQPAGTGLGLAICKGIVEAHGGRIAVTSNDASQSGTKFTVTLPVAASVAYQERDAS